SGQDRESDVFSTLADILDAMNANDLDALNALIDVFQADIDRLNTATGEVASRSARLTDTSDRYALNLISYQETWDATVGMDANALMLIMLQYQAAENAYNAAMSISARYFQMSLLSFL
ncbi:MAG: hypothetical protein LIP77_00425, partial [Planctomycetes bacterium]|nr:hypothetical protein [Planctomycetota bacterium]